MRMTGGFPLGLQMCMNEIDLIKEVDKRLRFYGNSRHGNPQKPIDDLVFIILSNQTEEYSYSETYEALRTKYPDWSQLLGADKDEIANAIRSGGLYNKKASQIKNALQKIWSDFGDLTLDDLRNLSDEDAITYLMSLPGISGKTARCILLYTLERKVFPVDTHVWRISRRLGLAPSTPKPTDRQRQDLEAKIPVRLRYTLHVNMVSHGRQTCTTYWPKCETCVLADICPSAGNADEIWGQWRKPRGAWANYKSDKKNDKGS